MNQRVEGEITHPDDLVKGSRYSVTLLPVSSEGRKRRITGMFEEMLVDKSIHTGRRELYVILEDGIGNTLGVCWRYSENWRRV